MSSTNKVKEAVEWYSEKRPIFEALADRVKSIITEILDSRKIVYHSITSRAKGIESYEKKASKEQYSNPEFEIKDMAGIRIILYIDSDAQEVAKIIRDLFEIIPEYSIDKT